MMHSGFEYFTSASHEITYDFGTRLPVMLEITSNSTAINYVIDLVDVVPRVEFPSEIYDKMIDCSDRIPDEPYEGDEDL